MIDIEKAKAKLDERDEQIIMETRLIKCTEGTVVQ